MGMSATMHAAPLCMSKGGKTEKILRDAQDTRQFPLYLTRLLRKRFIFVTIRRNILISIPAMLIILLDPKGRRQPLRLSGIRPHTGTFFKGVFMNFSKLRGIFILLFGLLLIIELIFFGYITVRTRDLREQYESQSALLSSMQAEQASQSESASPSPDPSLSEQIAKLQEEIASLQTQASEQQAVLEQKKQELEELQRQLPQ